MTHEQPPASSRPPPGWYKDPQFQDHERWWDGDRWTGHLRPVAAAEAAHHPTETGRTSGTQTRREDSASTSPAQEIRTYLEQQGGQTEAAVHHLLTTFGVEDDDKGSRQRIAEALSSAGITTDRALPNLDPDAQIRLFVIERAEEPAGAAPWASTSGQPPAGATTDPVPRPSQPDAPKPTPKGTGRERKSRRRRVLPRWRKMTWVLLLWTAIFAIWVIAGASSANCGELQDEFSKAGCDAGTGIGIALVFLLWFIGFLVLSLIWFMTRPRGRTCPACGENVKRGRTTCPNCGHDFAALARTRTATGPSP